ncbi:cbb3-type cytochrome c oxidase subunit I [Desulfosporosinus meridiei]|uniref:Nitric oxide reductase large subunit n=1 Tax=Desulfosporosinus meridiei (strain ATCC BAA-275 / DSM 13257 / KCTC 12902 / NCIMB 13706 / S10) TaxID=768704 RepID=J7J4K2_DESMD|nr:cbb3-type cytochrome c oxidase subunit I [Desulfosporosinus meridiei]AFQ46208.1 nitric oxide reductase large subunit [Desulfosporosinus meridiei DSM 13257]
MNQSIASKQKFLAQVISRRYCLSAVCLFALQSVVALMGALDLVISDLPSPIPFEYGRAIHLALADFWPLIGTMGMVYFFITAELNREIHSPRLARWQYWVVMLFTLSIFGTLALRLGNGREFLEGKPIFYLGICLALTLASYNLIRTLLTDRQNITPAAATMTVGMIFLLLLLLPNTITFSNPIVDEATKFWVVHLWEEMAFELTSVGFIATFFIVSGLANRTQIEKWLYLEAALAIVGGLYGTGHHYYWIGFPAVWLVLGSLVSLVEVIPVGMLVHMTYKGLKSKKIRSRREKLTLWLLLSSVFYHITGASLLGLFITIPWVNLYMHGTYFTSGHAHLALFGSLGFVVLAGCYYVLSQGSEPTLKEYKGGVLAVIILNIGLIIMSSALLAAGLKETYLWRVLGMDFMDVHLLLNPYLIVRVLGGTMFALGDLLLSWYIFKVWRATKSHK